MRVSKTHFIDAGAKDQQGFYEYYYEGDVYNIAFETVVFEGRTYREQPQDFAFLRYVPAQGDRRIFDPIPYNMPEFIASVRHLQTLGFTTFQALTGHGDGYENIDLALLGRA